jgi:hypothetical protein
MAVTHLHPAASGVCPVQKYSASCMGQVASIVKVSTISLSSQEALRATRLAWRNVHV